MDALYPNINRPLAMEAIENALRVCTEYSEELINVILQLVKFCLENSVVHYRGNWFKSEDGVPTGGPESGSIANIYVKWMLDTRLLVHPTLAPKNKIVTRLRFLDDLWFIWRGTERQFESFKSSLNQLGREDSFTLKGDVGSEVEFLDVKLALKDGDIETSVFIKPTDSKRYLHRRSDHSTHVFRGIPYSQFRRVVVIWSDPAEREESITYMENKFLASGYEATELHTCKEKALQLNREEILANHRNGVSTRDDESIITFVINHDPSMVKTLRKFFESKKELLERIIGDQRIMISERRSPNTASLQFAKSGFSSPKQTLNDNQR